MDETKDLSETERSQTPGAAASASADETGVTRILSAIEQGDPIAAGKLLPLSTTSFESWPHRNSLASSRGRRSRRRRWSTKHTCGWSERRGTELERARPFLRGGGHGHAAHPDRTRPPEASP